MDISKDITDFMKMDIHYKIYMDPSEKYYCIKYLLDDTIEYNVHTTYYYQIIEESEKQVRLSYSDGSPFAFWISKEKFKEHFATEQKTKLINLINE